MTIRKKKMIAAVIALVICGAAAFVLPTFGRKEAESENRRRNKELAGRWVSESGDMSMMIRRVTGGHIVFSLEAGENRLERATAYAVAGDQYEFPYSVSVGGNIFTKKYNIQYGGRRRGYIALEDSVVRLELPPADDAEVNPLLFQGTLKKAGEIAEDKAVHLGEYMGTRAGVPSDLKERCVFENGKDGRVAHIYVALTGQDVSKDLYYCDVNGVSKLCFENDCEALLGKATASLELNGGRKKKIYNKDGCRYAVVFEENGLAAVVDCRREEDFDGEFQGDFLCRDHRIIKYMGNYALGEKVEFPEGIKTICTGAFTAEDALYYGEPQVNELSIPASVKVEPRAFEKSGRWTLTLEEGRTVVTKEAFCRIMPKDRGVVKKAENWVTINLPESLKRFEKRAFFTTNKLDKYLISDKFPVVVTIQGAIRHIGRDALNGVVVQEVK